MNSWPSSRAVEKVKIPKTPEPLSFEDTASAEYTTVRFPTGHSLHVFKSEGRDDDGWQVWIDTEVADFDGLCVASEPTFEATRIAASRVFAAAMNKLLTMSEPTRIQTPETGHEGRKGSLPR